MNATGLKTISGTTIGAAIAWAVATNWEPILGALERFPTVVSAWSSGLPLGFASCAIAFFAGMAVWSLVYLHPEFCKRKPQSCADAAALGVSAGLILAQQAAGGSPTPAAWVFAMALTFMVAPGAPITARLLWSIFSPPKDQP